MKKILIANRGEIAVRIIRACADYGVSSVAVYADTDRHSLHVTMADEAWALPGKTPAETYLSIERLLDIARQSGADAVHPGYGFLSERAEFAKAVQEAGLIWIGPNPQTVAMLGDKVQARKIALKVGAPMAAGTDGPVSEAKEVLEFAKKWGVPIAIKAVYGGGGRGLKVAHRLDEIEELYQSAVREATVAFGRGECFVEQYLERPRHIEAQVIADRHGNVVVLGTRDCSLQRRNQKLIEEAPAPFLTVAQREQIHTAAKAICVEAGYISAGTVEFLLSSHGQISFLEVNTRLQVEHPVTEETTGIDVVVEQLRIADGLPLSIKETPEPRGHAMEFRINAEDVGRGFLPTPGTLVRFDPPSGPGIRLDSGVMAGSVVPAMFDSLIAKLIVYGKDREHVLQRARRALAEFHIEGIATVLPFHSAVLQDPAFTSTDTFRVHTRWIETEFSPPAQSLANHDSCEPESLQRIVIEIDGKRAILGLPASLFGQLNQVTPTSAIATAPVHTEQRQHIKSPISGNLMSWSVKEGDPVNVGEVIGTMEAMKMETSILSEYSGSISFLVKTGDFYDVDTPLAVIR